MSDLQHYLESINHSATSIKTLYFRPPGIFTNALISKPDITSLLRDADSYENSLYHVDPQGKAERADGTRGVVDHLNDEFENLEIQQQWNSEEIEQQNYQSDFTRPSVVLVPKEVESAVETSEQNKGVKNLLRKFNEANQGDYDVDVLCETVRQLLEKYPIDGVDEELVDYVKSWEALNSEIMKHEEIIERQRRQLSMLNISLNDRELGAFSHQAQSQKQKKSAKELIAEEEKEVRRLEAELEQRTKEQI